MNGILKGYSTRKPKNRPIVTMLFCLQCSHLFESSRTGLPCPRCADRATTPAANWAPAKYGMPRLDHKEGK